MRNEGENVVSAGLRLLWKEYSSDGLCAIAILLKDDAEEWKEIKDYGDVVLYLSGDDLVKVETRRKFPVRELQLPYSYYAYYLLYGKGFVAFAEVIESTWFVYFRDGRMRLSREVLPSGNLEVAKNVLKEVYRTEVFASLLSEVREAKLGEYFEYSGYFWALSPRVQDIFKNGEKVMVVWQP